MESSTPLEEIRAANVIEIVEYINNELRFINNLSKHLQYSEAPRQLRGRVDQGRQNRKLENRGQLLFRTLRMIERRTREQLQERLAITLVRFTDLMSEAYSGYAATFGIYPNLVQQLLSSNHRFPPSEFRIVQRVLLDSPSLVSSGKLLIIQRGTIPTAR
jgi:hypothetical protein